MVWMLFDSEMKLVKTGKSSGARQIPEGAGQVKQMAENDIVMDQGGFLTAYTVNESPASVYIDNFQLSMQNSPIMETNTYYPFGMINSQLSNQSTADPINNYKYNGKELQTELSLDWLDYGARFYDPQIGRWHSVDPLTDARTSYSPFIYCSNNSINRIDPNGAWDTKYQDEEGNSILNTNDGSDAVVTVTNDRLADFQSQIASVNKPGMKNVFDSKGWNDYWKKELLGFSLSGQQEGVLHQLNSDWSRSAAIKYWQTGSMTDGLSFAAKEAFSQWRNPYLVVGGLSAGLSGIRGNPKVQAFPTEYPANPAVPGTSISRTLYPGETFDRYGHITGKWGAPVGTEYGARSIPQGLSPYYKFQIVKPIKIEQSLSYPGNLSGQTGYGIQYQFSRPIDEYIPEYIKILTK